MTHRIDRSLLLEREPGPDGLPPINSIKDATWQHQAYAMSHGYKSMVEMAVDELAAIMQELRERVERLEAQVARKQNVTWTEHDFGQITP